MLGATGPSSVAPVPRTGNQERVSVEPHELALPPGSGSPHGRLSQKNPPLFLEQEAGLWKGGMRWKFFLPSPLHMLNRVRPISKMDMWPLLLLLAQPRLGSGSEGKTLTARPKGANHPLPTVQDRWTDEFSEEALRPKVRGVIRLLSWRTGGSVRCALIYGERVCVEGRGQRGECSVHLGHFSLHGPLMKIPHLQCEFALFFNA